MFFIFLAVVIVASAAQCPTVSVSRFNSSLNRLMWRDDGTVWATTDGSHVYDVFVSRDDGRTWQDQQPKMANQKQFGEPYTGRAGVRGIHHTSDPDIVYFTSWTYHMWVTRDGGLTYTEVATKLSDSNDDVHLQLVHPNPADPSALLASTYRDYREDNRTVSRAALLLSQDYGATWRIIRDKIGQAGWLDENVPGAQKWSILAAHFDRTEADGVARETGGMQLEVSHDLYETKPTSLLYAVSEIVSVFDGHIIAGQFKDTQEVNYNNVRLLLSDDGGSQWRHVSFPGSLGNQSRHAIIELRDGNVFLAVRSNSSLPQAVVLRSNHIADAFVPAISHVRRIVKTPAWSNIISVPGTFLANQYQEDDNLTTKITFDKGHSWQFLNVPDNEAQSSCTFPMCRLNLYFQQYIPELRLLPDKNSNLYSNRNAIGFAIGIGYVSSRLIPSHFLQEKRINTYLTRDGGRSWRKIADGQHTYAIGDHGAVIVLAKNREPSGHFLFSLDMGASWQQCAFASGAAANFTVVNVMAKTVGASEKFLLYDDEGHMVHVDFADASIRQCTGVQQPNSEQSDYETVTVSNNCVLGVRETFVRRKADRPCLNAATHEQIVKRVNCNCTRDDYRCDKCFFASNNTVNNVCIADDECIRQHYFDRAPFGALPLGVCNGTFMSTRGYVRLDGNLCDDSFYSLDAIETHCPKTGMPIREVINDAKADCCVPHGAGGCRSRLQTNCVCSFDEACCSDAWDQVCVVTNVRRCGATCNIDTDNGVGYIPPSSRGQPRTDVDTSTTAFATIIYTQRIPNQQQLPLPLWAIILLPLVVIVCCITVAVYVLRGRNSYISA